MKKIIIVTSGQPSANPRVLKEAIALSERGYSINVIYAPLSPWADEFDNELFLIYKNIRWMKIWIHPLQNSTKYKFIRLRRKVNEFLFKYAKRLNSLPENAFVLYAQELKDKAKKIRADIYIAHNLGALPAAVNAAKKFNALSVFDAEDYHRGEFDIGSLQYVLAKEIEDKYLPQVNYLTAASPLIAQAYANHYPKNKVEIINNVFSVKHLALNNETTHQKGLSLFWFSQTIGKERGLEDVCKALDKIGNENIKCYLLGGCTDDMKNYLKSFWVEHPELAKNLIFLPPCHPNKIFEIASKFDVGLALEQHISLNREYCLTNKIFTYLLSGNTIIASDTKAQKIFLEENKDVGFIYEAGNIEQLSEIINKLYQNPTTLIENKKHILQLAAEKFNFEIESIKLEKLIAEELSEPRKIS